MSFQAKLDELSALGAEIARARHRITCIEQSRQDAISRPSQFTYLEHQDQAIQDADRDLLAAHTDLALAEARRDVLRVELHWLGSDRIWDFIESAKDIAP